MTATTAPVELAAGATREGSLVERAMGGDADAFDALVALRLMATFRIARAILGTTEDAEDATQEAFVAAWRGLRLLRDPERFDAWFGRIVVNTCRMRLRQRPQATVVSIDSVAEGQGPWGEDVALDGLAETDAMNRAIDRLSASQRSILALYYLEDRPLASVAATLGIPLGTAKWRLYAARMALKRAMTTDDERPSVFRRLARAGARS